MKRQSHARLTGYLLVLLASFLVAMAAGYTALGRQIDADAYDWMFRLRSPAPWTPESALLEIDESSFLKLGGIGGLRSMLAGALERLAPVSPKVVVVDLTLAEAGRDPADDSRLEAAMSRTANLVLASEMMPRGEGWQDPIPRFSKWAAAVGHVHAAQEDGVNRQVPLEKVAGRERRWALALEAYRLCRGAGRDRRVSAGSAGWGDGHSGAAHRGPRHLSQQASGLTRRIDGHPARFDPGACWSIRRRRSCFEARPFSSALRRNRPPGTG